MDCPVCGEHNEEGMNYCTNCGSQLHDDDSYAFDWHDDHFEQGDSDGLLHHNESTEEKQTHRESKPKDNLHSKRTLLFVASVVVLIFCTAFVTILLVHNSISKSVQHNEDWHIDVDDTAEKSITAEYDPSFHLTSSILGNLINGGHFAESPDGTLFYDEPIDGTPWDTRSIVRCTPDRMSKIVIYSAPSNAVNVYHLSIIDDRLVFNQIIPDSSSVMTMDTNGQNIITIDKCDDWSLCQIDSSTIYYQKDDALWCSDISGISRTQCTLLNPSSLWRVLASKLYTFSQFGDVIYVSEIDGSNSSIAYKATDGFVIQNAYPIAGERLCVWEGKTNSHDNQIVIVDRPNGTQNVIWSGDEEVQRVCSSNSSVFLTTENQTSGYRIFSVGFDGTMGSLDFSMPYPGDVRYTSWLPSAICFGSYNETDSQCSLYCINQDGGDLDTLVY